MNLLSVFFYFDNYTTQLFNIATTDIALKLSFFIYFSL